MSKPALAVLAAAILSAACEHSHEPTTRFAHQTRLETFYKGNTHTHTERSFDSDAPIADVLSWYRIAGYHFVVITDHDVSAVPGEFFSLETPSFIAIAGEEITSYGFDEMGRIKPVHVNSICSNGGTVGGITLANVTDALIDAVDRAVEVSGAVAQINHPNLDYALDASHILAAGRATLIEIANQYPTAENSGDNDHRSVEETWDAALSSGATLYGVASDDTHDVGLGSYTPPGRGWVQVAADGLTPTSICNALRQGHFYASTGVEIERISIQRTTIALRMPPGDYETAFTGENGRLLATIAGANPIFRARGDEQYVRATVTASDGAKAWIQPQRLER